MNTPICDFARRYAESGALRLHMPGHKGQPLLGFEHIDITEFDGADSLYEAEGIIRESEDNASRLFGCRTLYSTEGSSQCIRAMLHLAALYARRCGKKPRILAGRNAHKTFLSGAALLDLDVEWLSPAKPDSYLSCKLEASDLEAALAAAEELPAAVYLTSPDYLGNVTALKGIAEVCRSHGVLLLVDNAHGAYLKFLPESCHPMDLGADLCCDSAHKTLPGLTGSAWLHIADGAPALFEEQAKNALALFGTTSPSYLILQSLDALNGYLAGGYKERLAAFLPGVQQCKDRLAAGGYTLLGDEPLKLTVDAKKYGYTGVELAQILLKSRIFCEFYDPDFLVMMVTPETGSHGLERLEEALLAIPQRSVIADTPPDFHRPQRVMSIREATLSPCETLPVADCKGKVLASASVGCPPAVPIVVCGERIDDDALRRFAYYGIHTCTVVK